MLILLSINFRRFFVDILLVVLFQAIQYSEVELRLKCIIFCHSFLCIILISIAVHIIFLSKVVLYIMLYSTTVLLLCPSHAAYYDKDCFVWIENRNNKKKVTQTLMQSQHWIIRWFVTTTRSKRRENRHIYYSQKTSWKER